MTSYVHPRGPWRLWSVGSVRDPFIFWFRYRGLRADVNDQGGGRDADPGE